MLKPRNTAAKKCLACKSPEVLTRGVCRKCYQNARNMISRGEAQERELIDAKLILPTRQGRNAVRDALLRRGGN